jgi:glucose/arabinose dehydrogenase
VPNAPHSRQCSGRARTIIGAGLLAVTIAALAGCGGASGPAPIPPDAAVAGANAHVRYARVGLSIPQANAGAGISSGQTLILPRGWRAEVWARVTGARLEAWTPQGQLLVSSPSSGTVYELTPGTRPSDQSGKRPLVSNLTAPQGLAFDELDGQEVLYVAEANEIDRYQWLDGRVGSRTVLVRNLPDTGPEGADVHTLKNVVVGPDHTIYVDIGSASNASPPGDTNPPRAAVIAYNPDGSLRRVIATGVRNGDGLSFAPDGSLWTAINERDNIAYPFHGTYANNSDAFGVVIQDYVNDHPPDELARLTPGRDVGWPYCNPDPDVHPGRAGTAMDYGDMRFDDDAETNPGGSRLDCAGLQPVERGIPAHSAPLGFHFLERSSLPSPWSGGAVVGVHGSWNRVPPRPPSVLWLPWEASRHTLGPAIMIVGGFQNADGSRWGRSVDAVAGPGGALYVSDDTAGAIYRIVPAPGF